ncbi:hypothetical protein ZIOFF_015515 [Zingiber officinale]|uniref:Uncharacterized protein n=1 Tax=Zingiber officinale TaxID=94328 RepID=A0A8J5LFC9_ZINOF|nr:hypothetical protein ZIOFF_015515 [Zingiber officinale]
MISSLIHMEHLNLSSAVFNGLIPQQLGNLSNLRSLDLRCCRSTQVWLDDLNWLTQLTSLEYLDMSCVDFSTAATSWLHQINYNSLEHLVFSGCWLEDATEDDTSIMGLNSSSNQLKENVSVNVFRKLKHLNLVGNSLTKIPFDMRSLVNLEYLDLSSNEITGEISLSKGNLIHLKHLDMSGNQISGEIPLNLCNHIHLEYLDLHDNQVTKEIPVSMENLIYLKYLDLHGN